MLACLRKEAVRTLDVVQVQGLCSVQGHIVCHPWLLSPTEGASGSLHYRDQHLFQDPSSGIRYYNTGNAVSIILHYWCHGALRFGVILSAFFGSGADQ